MALQNPNAIQDSTIVTENDKMFYSTIETNWFVAQPYGFKITFSDEKSFVCFLPISPSNLSITTHFATNMVPTLYGTVEEHSDVRYFDIAIEGTTGMAPKYIGVYKEKTGPFQGGGGAAADISVKVANLNFGRQSFSITKSIPLGGFFSKTIGALSAIGNSVGDFIDGSNKTNESAIPGAQTGYMAFHTLYKMLLRYKKDAAGVPVGGGVSAVDLSGAAAGAVGVKTERKNHPIIFFNYKDGNQYNVVIRNFTMRRSADNPMLYYYSISMRGYALTDTGGSPSPDNLEQRLKKLGLDGVKNSSILGDIKKKANAAKSILAAAAGGISVLGS